MHCACLPRSLLPRATASCTCTVHVTVHRCTLLIRRLHPCTSLVHRGTLFIRFFLAILLQLAGLSWERSEIYLNSAPQNTSGQLNRNHHTERSQYSSGVVAGGGRWGCPLKILGCRKLLEIIFSENVCPKMQNLMLKSPILIKRDQN